jgi:hypothetical protein
MPDIVDLLVEDAEDLVLGSLLGPGWGIYLNGVAVIQPATVPSSAGGGLVDAAFAAIASVQQIAGLLGGSTFGTGNNPIAPSVASTIQFEFDQDWSLPTYPQEQGAFQAYNKVTLPFDVKVRLACGGSVSDRQAFLQAVLAMANSTALFDVVTPEMTFTSCNVSHVSVLPRTAKNGTTLIQVDLYFQEIPVSSSTTFQNTAVPNIAGENPVGNVQPQTPNQYVQTEFSAGNWTVQ